MRLNRVEWSGDKRYAVLSTPHRFYIVNLETGTSADIGKALGLATGGRYARFISYSNDLRQIALIVGDYLDQSPPVARVSEDVITITLADNTMSYVATAQPHGWRQQAAFNWLPVGDGYIMRAAPYTAHFDGTIYEKPADQLPPGMMIQAR